MLEPLTGFEPAMFVFFITSEAPSSALATVAECRHKESNPEFFITKEVLYLLTMGA